MVVRVTTKNAKSTKSTDRGWALFLIVTWVFLQSFSYVEVAAENAHLGSFVAEAARRIDELRVAGVFRNEEMLAANPDRYREANIIGVNVSTKYISIPADVQETFFDETLSTNHLDGREASKHLVSVRLWSGQVLEFSLATQTEGLVIDSSVLDLLGLIGAASLRRSVNWHPGRTITYTNEYGDKATKDLSVYYHIRFDSSRYSPEEVLKLLSEEPWVDEAYLIGKCLDFDEDPPPPPVWECQYSDEFTDEQWYLNPVYSIDSGGIEVKGA